VFITPLIGRLLNRRGHGRTRLGERTLTSLRMPRWPRYTPGSTVTARPGSKLRVSCVSQSSRLRLGHAAYCAQTVTEPVPEGLAITARSD